MTWLVRHHEAHTTMFNLQDGNRVSFGPVPERLPAPELLDVKLTDVCSVGCAYCYQDSRPNRRHAPLEDVAFIAREAGKAGVFEVALGGGEVSEYPHFHEVLTLFRDAGVVPNFTTRRMRWLARHWPEFRDLVGGVAVSVNSAAEIRLLDSLIPVTQRRPGQLVVQVVMGTVERAELLKLVQDAGAAGIRVTLLGFKDVGRGQTFKPLEYGWWLTDLQQCVQHAQISIDTALASENPEQLAELLLPGSYHTEEGRFSAYVDAVNMTLAPSSYHEGPVHLFNTDWLDAFASIDFVQGPRTPPVAAPPHTISRVRLGFATNSSSSHSLVLLAEPVADDPPLTDHKEWVERIASWGPFIVASREAKKHYLAANLAGYYYVRGELSQQAEQEVLELCDLPPETSLQNHAINHQSQIDFERQHGLLPAQEQVERVRAILLSENVAVYGHGDGAELFELLNESERQPILLELDKADFRQTLSQTYSGEPAPSDSWNEDAFLYVLGLVHGHRMKQVVQRALEVGFTWEDVRIILFDNDDYWEASQLSVQVQQDTTLTRLLAAVGLSAHPSCQRDDQRFEWFRLYLRYGSESVNALRDRLNVVKTNYSDFSERLWYYTLNHQHQLPIILEALNDVDSFAKAAGIGLWDGFNRIDEYLSSLSTSP